MKKNIKIVLIIISLSILILFGLIIWSLNAPAEKGENIQSVDWLPGEATNISFYKRRAWVSFEFNISEQGFFNWAKKWTKAEVKIIDKPVEMWRYTYYTIPSPSPDSSEEIRNEYQSKIKKTINHGYYYMTPPRPNGGGTHIGYDLDTGRAYLTSTPW